MLDTSNILRYGRLKNESENYMTNVILRIDRVKKCMQCLTEKYPLYFGL